MPSKWRRFEVLLPLQFNDGAEVPPDWLAEAMMEIVDHFGAASYETQKVEGHWRQEGVVTATISSRLLSMFPTPVVIDFGSRRSKAVGNLD